jgi:hypothetical protein
MQFENSSIKSKLNGVKCAQIACMISKLVYETQLLNKNGNKAHQNIRFIIISAFIVTIKSICIIFQKFHSIFYFSTFFITIYINAIVK